MPPFNSAMSPVTRITYIKIAAQQLRSSLLLILQYVTRAVRVVDLITNLDMQAFQQYGGMTAFINRLQVSGLRSAED